MTDTWRILVVYLEDKQIEKSLRGVILRTENRIEQKVVLFCVAIELAIAPNVWSYCLISFVRWFITVLGVYFRGRAFCIKNTYEGLGRQIYLRWQLEEENRTLSKINEISDENIFPKIMQTNWLIWLVFQRGCPERYPFGNIDLRMEAWFLSP